MTDIYGHRLKLGVVTPSVNTVVQYEYDRMRPEGVTNHISRIHVPNITTDNDDALLQSVTDLDRALDNSVESVLTAEPGVIVLGVSIEAIYGDPAAGGAIQNRLRDKFNEPNLTLIHAGDALPAALRAYGIEDGPISILSPYGPQGEPHLTSFVEHCGYKLHSVRHLVSDTLVKIAHNPPERIRPEVDALAESGPQAIVQFGANLPFGQVAARAETELGIPVIAVNTATYWYALRMSGIDDKITGFGRLLSEF
ncbi:IgiC (plasmid) [Rhodococcus sp. USK10]|nr:IgiC [Rhodococcus sp. USK10]